jgi:cobyrinic acid a,c-diamide synthase
MEDGGERIHAIGEFFEKHVSVNGILERIGEHSPPRRGGEDAPSEAKAQTGWSDRHSHGFAELTTPALRAAPPLRGGECAANKRVAVACDKAFSFYYHANLSALRDTGAEILEFSPISDKEVPDADLLYIGGGYPELCRVELEANASMRASIRRFIESGKKFYAECGGLMYLAQSIEGAQMVGIIPTRIEMTERLVDFGYCEIRTNSESILGPPGTIARGHQFHYSRSVGPTGGLYSIQQGSRTYAEGFVFPNGVASYVHLHFLSNPVLARNMLNS